MLLYWFNILDVMFMSYIKNEKELFLFIGHNKSKGTKV